MKEVTDVGLDRVIKMHDLISVAFLERGRDTTTYYIPELKEVSGYLKNRMRFYMISFGENPAAFEKYNVPYRPTLVVYRKAQEIKRFEGPHSAQTLFEKLHKLK